MTEQQTTTGRAYSKAARRKRRKTVAAAVAAQIWEDRAGKARPTAERRAKGKFVLRDGDDAGVTVAVDEGVTVLDRLALAGVITEDQRQAGHDLAAVLYRTRLGSTGRSCIDMSPVGYEGDDLEETHQEVRDRQQRAQVFQRCRGPWVWPELVRVCRDDQRPRSIEALRDGLDVAVAVFGR